MMRWTRGCLIGRGSTATVSTATDCHSRGVFAVKSAELTRSQFLVKEQSIMARLVNCPQIVSYKGWDISCEEGVPMYNLWLEYAPHGTIADAICSRGGSIHEDEIRLYVREILLGLGYLHSVGIVHCDIKPQNILLTSEGAKIADFGCARRADEEAAPPAGTPIFMAPEVARRECQSYPADVWAVGCTVVQMATGRAAWADDVADPISALHRIGFSNDVPGIPEFMSGQGKDFLSKCLRRAPSERWTVQELLRHPFLEDSVSVNKLAGPDSTSNSPTSVFDQSIWLESEAEESEQILLPVPGRSGSSSDSPMERMNKLCEVSRVDELPRWGLDDNWVDVRGSSELRQPATVRLETPSSSQIDNYSSVALTGGATVIEKIQLSNVCARPLSNVRSLIVPKMKSQRFSVNFSFIHWIAGYYGLFMRHSIG